MTIIAGFRVIDGIVLCGDTMYTGAGKIHESKLVGAEIKGTTVKADHSSLAFALAGNEANARMAIEDCIDGFGECPIEQRTLKRVTEIFRTAVLRINREYVHGRSETERFNAQFELIIGAWLPRGGGCQMFATSGDGVVFRPHYECHGSGAYLGHYIIKPVYSTQMGFADAALLAIQAIAAAKNHDPACGGDTHFMTISQGGELSGIVPHDFRNVEGYLSKFDKESRVLLFRIANTRGDDAQFEECLKFFNENMRSLRAIWSNRTIEFLLSNLRIQASINPQPTTPDRSGPPPSPE
jgi:20S proteasome alpha/beta subunit